MLTGCMIKHEVESGKIQISDFDSQYLQPNSYELHWGDSLIKVELSAFDNCVDMLKEANGTPYNIPEDGLVIYPDSLYLISTKEVVGSDFYIPQIVGRSSVGRMGIQISQQAAFGDLGYIGTWTLQVSVKYPTRIYPNLRVCHVFFEEPYGITNIHYSGRYQNSSGPVLSKFVK